MFPESFSINLALFVIGQAAAWCYLRSGRLWVGGVATIVLWIAADWALLAKFAFEDDGAQFLAPLWVMQITALVVVAMFLFAQWRRRWSNAARRRPEVFAAGTAAYLRGAHDEAARAFRRLVRIDPWDAAAWLALGNAHRRGRRLRAARRCYRRCRRVDVAREYTDLARRLGG